jgi:hypothetical protein
VRDAGSRLIWGGDSPPEKAGPEPNEDQLNLGPLVLFTAGDADIFGETPGGSRAKRAFLGAARPSEPLTGTGLTQIRARSSFIR